MDVTLFIHPCFTTGTQKTCTGSLVAVINRGWPSVIVKRRVLTATRATPRDLSAECDTGAARIAWCLLPGYCLFLFNLKLSTSLRTPVSNSMLLVAMGHSRDFTHDSRHGGDLVHVGAHDGIDKAEVSARLEGLVAFQRQLRHRLAVAIHSANTTALPQLGQDERVVCKGRQRC